MLRQIYPWVGIFAITDFFMEELLALRHRLHRYPELSGREKITAGILEDFLHQFGPDQIIRRLGGHGIAVVFESGNPGHEVLFRADMDALPISETLPLTYASVKKGVSHKCGHDGHAAILSGLARYISENRPVKGRYILLFQPAEETGIGALSVLRSRSFVNFKPDYAFALHNLPGYSRDTIVVRTGTFAAASRGMVINLKGRTSHASEPEKGQSPSLVLAKLMNDLPKLSGTGAEFGFSDFALLTIIYGSLGSPAFGTSPGHAVLMATLRAYLDSDMEVLIHRAEGLVADTVAESGISATISFQEEFPATTNHADAVSMVTAAASKLNLKTVNAGLPFRWSEDFAHFALRSKAALFGIGAGISHKPLHDPDYDFPDPIISTGVSIWVELYRHFAF